VSLLAGKVSPLLASGPGRTSSLRCGRSTWTCAFVNGSTGLYEEAPGCAPTLGDVGFRQHRSDGLSSAVDVHEQTPLTLMSKTCRMTVTLLPVIRPGLRFDPDTVRIKPKEQQA
jgi:hypothetical protein